MRNRIKLLPFNNVVASGVATCDLQNLLGNTIKRIVLNLGGGAFTKSMIASAQIKANGKIIFDSTGPLEDSLMQFRSIANNAAFLTLDFSEIKAKTQLGEYLGAIDTTLGINSLKLEVTTSGATTPTLQGWAEITDPQVDPAQKPTRNLIARKHKSTITIGAAGTFALPVPHLDVAVKGSIFKRIGFFSSNMTALLIKKNGIVVEDTTSAFNSFNQQEYGRTPQAGLFVYDAIETNNQSEMLNTRDAQTMEVYGTFSAGETITIVSEVVEPLQAF